MNLIEQLGGYEKAKEWVNPSIEAISQEVLKSELLKYRRQHNIFEVGDKYVMLKLWHDDLMTVEDGEMDEPWWNERIIRHATDVEIKAGKRLEVNQ